MRRPVNEWIRALGEVVLKEEIADTVVQCIVNAALALECVSFSQRPYTRLVTKEDVVQLGKCYVPDSRRSCTSSK